MQMLVAPAAPPPAAAAAGRLPHSQVRCRRLVLANRVDRVNAALTTCVQERAEQEAAQRARADARYSEAAQQLEAERGRLGELQRWAQQLEAARAEAEQQLRELTRQLEVQSGHVASLQVRRPRPPGCATAHCTLAPRLQTRGYVSCALLANCAGLHSPAPPDPRRPLPPPPPDPLLPPPCLT